jgi:hypothetical protein
MANIPIIGQTKVETAEPRIDSLSAEDRAALEAIAAKQDDSTHVATAFTVVIHHDGSIDAVADLTKQYTVRRLPTADDILAAIAVVGSDVQTSKTASHTASMMMQMTQAAQQQMMQAQEAAQIRSRLQRDPKLHR